MKRNLLKYALSSLFLALMLHVQTLDVRAGGLHLYDSGQLSSSQINCICQDRYGYIWVGTEYGLNRFDGYNFVKYLHENDDPTSISHNIVTSLLCDKEGNLWIGVGNGFEQYDYRCDCFRHFKYKDGCFRANAIAESADGELFVGTAGNGLLHVNKAKGELTRVNDITDCSQKKFFSRLCIDSHGLLWKGSHMPEFSIYNIKDGELVRVQDFKSSLGAPSSFVEYGNKMLIVCIFGILAYDYNTGQVSDYGIDFSRLDPGVLLRRALVDHKGDLLLSTRGNGLMVVPKGSKTLVNTDKPATFGLNNLNVNAIFEDKDQNLWLGCYHKGLLLLNGQEDAFMSWNFSERFASKGSCVISMVPGNQGETWCTIENDGLYRLDSIGNIIKQLRSPFDTRLIYRDRKQRFWLCTEKTLYSYNPDAETYSPILNAKGWGFNCILDDQYGNLYLSNNGNGLIVYNADKKATTYYSMNLNVKNGRGLRNDWVQSMAIDENGMLWIGTADGLECLDTKKQEFLNLGDKTPLKGLQCTAISMLTSGKMLICTDSGIFVYNPKLGEITELFGSEPYLSDKNICGVVTDKKGDLWFSTSNGIWQYDINSHKMIAHISGNGLISKEYITSSLCHYADDRIAFGTPKGITVFYPEVVKNHETRARFSDIILTKIMALGKNLDVTKDYFELPSSENSFQMRFSMMNYKGEGNMAFQWRINDSDEWMTSA